MAKNNPYNYSQIEVGSGTPLPSGAAPVGKLSPWETPDNGQLQVNPESWRASNNMSPADPWQGLFDRMRNKSYQGVANENGSLKDAYKVTTPDYVKSIQNRYTELYDDGASPGLSNWGQSAYDRSRADQGYAMEDARGQAQSDAANGMNILAMQGGLESGAAENMLRSASRTANDSRTNLYRQGSMDRMGIDVADAARKDTMRTQGLAGGMDIARFDTDIQNLNTGRAIDDLGARNSFDFGKIGFEGQMEAARATAGAMGKSVGKGSGSTFDGVLNTTGDPQKDFMNWNPKVGLDASAENVSRLSGGGKNLWSNNPSYNSGSKGYKQY